MKLKPNIYRPPKQKPVELVILQNDNTNKFTIFGKQNSRDGFVNGPKALFWLVWWKTPNCPWKILKLFKFLLEKS